MTEAGLWNFGSSATPTQLITLDGQAARQIFLSRHTTANTAGNSLSVIAGGATLLATDKNGGLLYLKPGQSTGTGSAASSLWATPVGAAGTTTNDPVQVLTCGPLSGGAAGTTAVGILTTTPAYPLDVVGAVNIAEGQYYRYGAGILAYAQTALHNYYFGSAGNLTTTGTYNTIGGDNAGIALAALAHGNTMWGASAGTNITTGDGNVCIGFKAGSALTTESNKLYIANSDAGLGSLFLTGDFSTGNLGLGTATFDATAQIVLSLATGIEPSAHVDDAVQLYSFEAAGAILGVWDEIGIVAGKTASADEYMAVRYCGQTRWLKLYNTPA
jgi:hypothetical protein